MLKQLKKHVCEANKELVRHGLVIFTWGNVSGFDREKGLMVIKPSGVPYDELTPDDMSIVSSDGEHIGGGKPSSDSPTHLALYKRFPQIGGIAHTHSTWATACAQAGIGIPCLGTTHADYFYGDIPITRDMTDEEINGQYEAETGKVILEAIQSDPMVVPAVLVRSHAPFAWGADCDRAVHNAVALEEVARMFVLSRMLTPDISAISPALLDRHFLRKHGMGAYYGQ
ncbi:MAG: L-ribulose-5-phosphate 4-epimerase [Clostridiales bacterium]|jgi:L-ribulose-5-phosphate 4-epimerase|nr:L-ribulose-5-phosphate 4-epimerase [Clostridiales bacterium]